MRLKNWNGSHTFSIHQEVTPVRDYFLLLREPVAVSFWPNNMEQFIDHSGIQTMFTVNKCLLHGFRVLTNGFQDSQAFQSTLKPVTHVSTAIKKYFTATLCRLLRLKISVLLCGKFIYANRNPQMWWKAQTVCRTQCDTAETIEPFYAMQTIMNLL